jgi:hypothetical protein
MYWYNETTKNYIIAISKLFSDIHVKRVNDSDVEIKDIKVPLVYASKRKINYKLNRNPNTESASLVLPVIGFNLENINYNSNRKLNSINKIPTSSSQYVFEGVPYDYTFDITIKTKYQDDMFQIVEQLLYQFKPEVNLNIKEIPSLNISRDCKIKLNDVNLNFETELTQAEDSIRELEASLNITLEGFVYPMIKDSVFIYEVINDIKEYEYLGQEEQEILTRITHTWQDPDIITVINNP